MSVAFAARRGRDGWRIGPVAPGAADAWSVSDDDIRRFTAASNRLIGALISEAALPDEAWRLEIEKLCAVDGSTALGVAGAFAARCLAAPSAEHRLEGEPRDVQRWALMAALAARGERVEGLSRARLAARLRYLAAAAAGAMAAWGAILLREPGGGRLPDADLIFAVHPEETNRTGHVLNALAKSAPHTPLILLGRPMASRQAVRALLARRGLEPAAAVRPYDIGSALAALPATLRRLWRGADAIAASPFLPSFREQMASAFRVCLGGAGAVWWRRQGNRPDTVVYGHCGSADTVLLERAQQAAGTRTVHWLHGLSAGYVYGGVSDACVFQCGSDARWHERLGGYGRNLAYPLPRPPLRTGEAGWLVLTNFVHWAHPTFPTHGTRDERLMMELVADAAARAGVPPAEVVWKPHPVLYAMSPQVQDEVRAALAQHGFALWPPEDRDFGRAAAFATIVSTPSGAAVDVLKLGRLPVIAALGPVDPDHALAGFPLYARTGEALCEAALAPADPALFGRAWAAVQPGAAPSLQQLAQAAQSIAADGPPGVVCAPVE